MPRWEPNSRERLVEAALDLFTDRGYEATTVADIAERAGLTKSSFFRHFPDKREVLFVDQDLIRGSLVEGIDRAAAGDSPLEAVAAGLDAVAKAFPSGRRRLVAKRRAVVHAHPELQEREALKRAGSVVAMREALVRRGVPEAESEVAAELGLLAFRRAQASWAEADDPETFVAAARRALDQVRAASATLR
jgi:AcrR family transcriptional regulator